MVVVDLKFDAAARGGHLYPRGIGAANLRHSLRNVRNCAFSSTSHVNRGIGVDEIASRLSKVHADSSRQSFKV